LAERYHLDDAGFLVTQHMSRLYASVDEVGPRRYTECHAFHVGTALEAIQRGWHALHPPVTINQLTSSEVVAQG
jgi:hypothetical protein